MVLAERFLERLVEMAPEPHPVSKTVIVPDARDELPDLPVRGHRAATSSSTARRRSRDLPGPDYCDVCAMIYTSGTTGPSKGVLVPWAELY